MSDGGEEYTAEAGAGRGFSRGGLAKALGPGILLAGSAVGGSHLIQATRGGALHGYSVVWLVLAVMLLKYPFFEFAHRYAAATGQSLLAAYHGMGRGVLWLGAGVLAVNAMLGLAGLAAVTAGLSQHLLLGPAARGTLASQNLWAGGVLALCLVLAFARGFGGLDKAMKVLVAVMSVSTLAAFLLVLGRGEQAPGATFAETWRNPLGLLFCVQLIGWMPAPFDGAVCASLWSVQRQRDTAYRPRLREALFDFRLGYLVTAVLAVAFVGLGTGILHGRPEEFPEGGVQFAGVFTRLYTETLGGWSFVLIAVAAITCMLSTALTALDGYARVLAETARLSRARDAEPFPEAAWRLGAALFLVAVALVSLLFLRAHMLVLINIAMTVAFLSSPLLAWLNYRAVAGGRLPPGFRPGPGLHLLSVSGMVFLLLFVLFFLLKAM